MRRLINIFITPTALSTAIYYFGNFAVSASRYLFHLVLLRLLLPGEYGEFLTYLSFLYLLSIPNGTVGNVVIKFVAEFRGQGDSHSINRFFYYLLKRLLPLTLLLGLPLVIFSNSLAVIFKAHPTAFIILGLSLFTSLIATLVKSYLIAFHRFNAINLISFMEVILSIILAILLINANLSATGAVSAQIIASVFGLIVVLILIRKSIFPPQKGQVKKFKLGSFLGYSFINAVGSISLISTDILLVRYFFSAHLSGIYASLSVVGRIIYFGLAPLIGLILPIATHRYAAKKSIMGVFLKLGGTVLFFGLVATTIFTLFPANVIGILSGKQYLEAAPLLPVFSFTMLAYSLNIFIISNFMAIGKPQANLYLLLATFLQPILIIIFHDSLSQVVWLNLFIELSILPPLIWSLKRANLEGIIGRG